MRGNISVPAPSVTYQRVNLEVGKTYTYSIWLRSVAGAGTYPINFYDGAHHRLLAPLTEQWQRFTITGTPTAALGYVYLGDTRVASDFTEAYVWGTQKEFGSVASRVKETKDTAGAKIPASDLYKLRSKIARLLEYKAGKARPIYRFDGVGMYGDIPEWTANGDFEIRGSVVGAAGSGYEKFADSTNNRTDLTCYKETGAWQLRNYGEWKESSLALDGTLQEIMFYRNSAHADQSPRSIDSIGVNNTRSAGYWGGGIAHVALIDLDNPLTNSRLYLMDDATGILYDALAEIGSDEKVFTVGSSWTDNGDGTHTHTGQDWWSWLTLGGTAGKAYLVDLTVTNASSTAVNHGTAQQYATNGRQTVFVPAGTAAPRIGSNTGTTVEVHSVREAPNAGQIQNAPADAYPLFVYQGEHKKEWWEQPLDLTNISTTGNMVGTTPSTLVKTVGSNWNVFGSVYPQGTILEVSYNYDIAGANLYLTGHDSYDRGVIGVGRFEFRAIANGNKFGWKHPDAYGTLTNVSVREVIKEAV